MTQPYYAFKEWQLVCEALATGEQNLILRKGGISEGKSGFEWKHDRFFLMPTRYHRQEGQLKPRVDGTARTLPDQEESLLSFSLFAEITEKGRLTDWQEIAALGTEHIWKEEVIRERFDWGKEPGISWARVRVIRLPEPIEIPNSEAFGGCKSWIEIPNEFQERFQTALEGLNLPLA